MASPSIPVSLLWPVIRDDQLTLIYPIPRVSCSRHPKLGVRHRTSRDIMLHLCGKFHHNRFKYATRGSCLAAIKEMEIKHVCYFCGYLEIEDPKLHFQTMHPGLCIYNASPISIDLSKI